MPSQWPDPGRCSVVVSSLSRELKSTSSSALHCSYIWICFSRICYVAAQISIAIQISMTITNLGCSIIFRTSFAMFETLVITAVRPKEFGVPTIPYLVIEEPRECY